MSVRAEKFQGISSPIRALLVTIYDGSECGGQVGQRIDGIELMRWMAPSSGAIVKERSR